MLQEYSFRKVELLSLPTEQGPSSWSKPMSEEPPGPPFSHMDNGAFLGPLRDSKNQKKLDNISSSDEYDKLRKRLTY